MNNQNKSSLSIFAKMLAEEQGAKLVFGQSKNNFKSNDIFIPSVNESEFNRKLVVGFIVKESSRIRNSKSLPLMRSTSLQQNINTIINDIWFEYMAMRQYKGARQSLNDLLDIISSADSVNDPIEETLQNLFFTYIEIFMRVNINRQTVFTESLSVLKTKLAIVFPSEFFFELEHILMGMKTSFSTEQNAMIAAEVVNLLKSKMTEDDNQQANNDQMEVEIDTHDSSTKDSENSYDESQGEGEESQEQDVENGQATEDGKAENSKNADASQTSGKSEDESKDTQSQEGKASGDGKSDEDCETKDGNSQTDKPSQDGNQNVDDENDKAEINKGNGKTNEAANMKALLEEPQDKPLSVSEKANALFEQIEKSHNSSNTPMSNEMKLSFPIDGSDLLLKTKQSTTSLRYKLEAALVAHTRKQNYYAKKGRVIPTRVWRLRHGNMKVFNQVCENKTIDTSILVLVDCSSSMDTKFNDETGAVVTRKDLAIESTLAMAIALDEIKNLKIATAAFPMFDKDTGNQNAVCVLKDFEQKSRTSVDLHASMKADGGTPMADAALWAIYKLLSQKSERKILFIQTDGEPNNKSKFLEIAQLAQSHGIEIIGVGIGINIEKLIPDSVSVMALDQLPAQLFSLLTKKLTSLAA